MLLPQDGAFSQLLSVVLSEIHYRDAGAAPGSRCNSPLLGNAPRQQQRHQQQQRNHNTSSMAAARSQARPATGRRQW